MGVSLTQVGLRLLLRVGAFRTTLSLRCVAHLLTQVAPSTSRRTQIQYKQNPHPENKVRIKYA